MFKSVVGLLFTFCFVQAQVENGKKNHIEDIFIWKMSDELKLTALEEKKFGEIQKELNKKKSDLSASLQSAALEIRAKPELSLKEQASLIKKNRQFLSQYNLLATQEFDAMKNLLGPKKFLEYLAVKQELNTKLKSMVLGDKNLNGPIEPPKVIEEK